MERNWLSSPDEKDPRITVDIKLETSEWCALLKRRTIHMLGFIRENVASRSMQGIIHTLPVSCAVNSKYCVQFVASRFKRHAENHERATKMAEDTQPMRRG